MFRAKFFAPNFRAKFSRQTFAPNFSRQIFAPNWSRFSISLEVGQLLERKPDQVRQPCNRKLCRGNAHFRYRDLLPPEIARSRKLRSTKTAAPRPSAFRRRCSVRGFQSPKLRPQTGNPSPVRQAPPAHPSEVRSSSVRPSGTTGIPTRIIRSVFWTDRPERRITSGLRRATWSSRPITGRMMNRAPRFASSSNQVWTRSFLTRNNWISLEMLQLNPSDWNKPD